MSSNRILPLIISVAILILIAIIQERSKFLAAILATMPVSIPLSLWIIFSANRQDYAQTTLYTRSMLIGIIPTIIFLIIAWIGLRSRLSFPLVILSGYAAWGICVLVLRWILGGT